MVRNLKRVFCGTVGIVLFMLSSCVSTKKISYLNDIPDSNFVNAYEISLAKYSDPKIQPNDILQVSIQTLDPQSSAMMGVQNASTFNVQSNTAGIGAGTPIQGYQVDSEGYISIPLVGKVQVNGLSTTQVKKELERRAALYYKTPVVNVRFVNFTVIVLGEVQKTGQITVSNEKTSIFDVIGAAGDLTPYARRGDILLIREEDGVKKFIRLNLYKKSIFQSPYFYMHQRDVIYVYPNKSKAINSNSQETRILGYGSILLSVITLLLYFKK